MGSTRAVLAAVFSAFVLGSGHLLARAWRRAAVLLGINVLVLVATLAAWRQGTDTVLGWVVQPPVLRGVLALNLVLLGVRVFAVVDSYRVARPSAPPARPRRSWGWHSVLGAVVLFTILPHVAAGYYTWHAYQLLTLLFVADPPPAAAASMPPARVEPTRPPLRPTTTPAATPTAAVATSLAPPRPGTTPGRPIAMPLDGGAAPPPTAIPSDRVTDDWLNILLLGGDAGPERTGLRTDTMIVASIDPGTGQAALLGVPRNLKNVPLVEPAASQFACRCWPDMLNALYGYAHQHPDLFPAGADPGAEALQATIGALLGVEIDHYALVDLGGFVDVIDAVGGVTLEVPERTVIRISPAKDGGAWRTFDIPSGQQHLDGEAALAYARNRSDADDYVRMNRQRCVLGAVAKGTDTAALVRAFPRLVAVIRARVNTDIPVADLPGLIQLANDIEVDALKTVGLVPPHYSAGLTPDGYPIPNVVLIQHTVRTIFDPPADPAHTDAASMVETHADAASMVETAVDSCGWRAAP